MRKKIFIPILFILFASAFTACGIQNNDRQEEVDRATRALALDGRTFVSFFQDDLNSCNDFLKIFDEMSEAPQKCDNIDGTLQLTKLSVNCEGGSPLQAQALFLVENSNCEDKKNDVLYNGPFNLRLEFSSEGNFAFIISDNLLINDIQYQTSNFNVKVEFSNNNLNCDGSLNVSDGDFENSCDVDSNCKSCNI